MKKDFGLFFAISALGVIFLDQVSKYLILRLVPEWNLGILKIHLVKNTGAGFGILQGQTVLLALLSFIVATAVLINYTKIEKERISQLLWGLFLGGVVGNMVDRFLRNFVIDFIDLSFWPAFNIADAALTVSVIGLVLYYWKK